MSTIKKIRAEGAEEGRREVLELSSYLIKNNRLDDFMKAMKDDDYFEKLLEEREQAKKENASDICF